MGFNAAILRRRRRLGGGSGLSISAPSAVLFADGDQPIELWDYEAHNLLEYSEDFSQWTNTNAVIGTDSTTAPDGNVTADTIGDNSAGGAQTVVISQLLSAVLPKAGRYEFSVYAKQKQLSWAALQAANFDVNTTAYFDVGTGAVGTVSGSGSASSIEAAAEGFYRCKVQFDTEADQTGDLKINVAEGNNDLLVDRDGTSDIYAWGAQLRDVNSPDTYVATTGSIVSATDGLGSIQFADAQYDSGADSYKVNLDIADGDMTLQTTSGLTFTPTTGGDGTADASMEFTGTLAACLAALRGLSVDNVAVGTVDLDVLITHPATSRTASKTISVTSTGSLTADAGWFTADTTDYTADAA